MTVIGTPFSATAKKVLLLGSGEIGKEIAIELTRFGVEVIAADSYDRAPAMQVAARKHVFSMLDGAELRRVIELEKPDLIVPEVEAIATDTLIELEGEGYTVIPTARATKLTMNREGIRRLAAEELKIPTSRYLFADTKEEFIAAANDLGYPCVIKPVMSSSGKGQTIVRGPKQIEEAWEYSQNGGRAGNGRVIVERFVLFDYEITLLTVRHIGGVSFCPPIGHLQIDGDYRESWQPQAIGEIALKRAEIIAEKITSALGGFGIFGVELFIKENEVIFSEVSPRPHDTGLVTLISQYLSEFALHARAILGLPIPTIATRGTAASAAVVVEGNSSRVAFGNLENALAAPNTALRLFGKPSVDGHRRMGVALALGATIAESREKARAVRDQITIAL